MTLYPSQYDNMSFRSLYDIPLTIKLLVEFGNIVVPLGLEKVPSNRLSQIVLLSKFPNGKLPTVVPRTVRESLLSKVDLSRLLVDQKDVAMKTWEKMGQGCISFRIQYMYNRKLA